MAKVLLKKVPRRTDQAMKREIIRSWNEIIVEKYSSESDIKIPVMSAKEWYAQLSASERDAYTISAYTTTENRGTPKIQSKKKKKRR